MAAAIKVVDGKNQVGVLTAIVKEEKDQPVLVTNALDANAWSLASWQPENLGEEFANVQVEARFARVGAGLLEGEGVPVHTTMREFALWLLGKNELAEFDRQNWWAYASYLYTSDLFRDTPEALSRLAWNQLGLDAVHENCAFWMGSAGAFTPLHYDVYGCNVAVQLAGRKHWWLFPPNNDDLMYPTRLPFEESTVFSRIRHPQLSDLSNFSQFHKAKPVHVVLEAGQALYVPQHWWHFVECESVAVSVNQWLPRPADVHHRVREGLTRYLIGSILADEPTSLSNIKWINLNEHVGSNAENLELLSDAFQEINDDESSSLNVTILQNNKRPHSPDLSPSTVKQPHVNEENLKEALLHAISHPSVVIAVEKALKEYLGQT